MCFVYGLWLSVQIGFRAAAEETPQVPNLLPKGLFHEVPVRLPPVNSSEIRLTNFVTTSEAPKPEPAVSDGLLMEPASAVLSLKELEQMALAQSPALAEARARVQALQGKRLQVGLPPNTVAGYSGQQLGSGGVSEQQGVYLRQEFIRGGKLRLNRAVVGQEVAVAEEQWMVAQRRILTDVHLSYYDTLIAQRRRDLAEQLVQIAGEAVEIARAMYPQELRRFDVLRIELELQSAELLLQNTREQYSAAWSRLTAVLGTPNLFPQALEGDLDDIGTRLDYEELLARLISESPEMSAAMREAERARWEVRRACAEPVSNVDFQAILQSDNDTNSSNANIQVAMAIPWLDRNQGAIRQAHAEAVVADRAIDRLKLSFRQRLATAFQRYAVARNQVESYVRDGGILANAEITLEFVSQAFEAGEVSSLELVTAQRNYSQARLAYVEALGDFWAANTEINGLLLMDSLRGE